LDSIIIESRAVAAGLSATPPDTAFELKVYVTNKDTITYMVLALRVTTFSGTGYAVLTDDGTGFRDFVDVVRPLNSALDRATFFDAPGYDEASPDSFLAGGGWNPTPSFPRARSEAPNAVRDDIWSLRFKQTTAASGCVLFDTVTWSQPTGFAVIQYNPGFTIVDVPVNFVAGIVDVGNTGTCTTTAVIDVNPGQRPTRYSLSQNYPNPFNANTQISFALPKDGRTTLEIFNVLGQKVNTLVDEYMRAGTKIVNWDGRDNRGMEVPSGIYFYRLRSENFLQTKKMLMIQ
jgi:hypothetical protein